MKKVLALLGLVLLVLGVANVAKAGSGSSSSGEFSWSAVCGDNPGVMTFHNDASSAGGISVVTTAGYGHYLEPGDSWLSEPDSSRFDQWSIIIEGDSDASDSGYFSDCTGIGDPDPDPVDAPEGVSYTLECADEDLIFSNTGERPLRIMLSLAFGQPVYTVTAGASHNFGTPGVDTGNPGTRYEVWYEEPIGSNAYTGLEEGNFPDCTGGAEEPDPSFTVGCGPFGGASINFVTNTGNVPIDVIWELTPGTGPETITVAPGDIQPIADTTNDLSYVIGWNDGGTFVVLEEGEWGTCEDTGPTLPVSEMPPTSQCRGTDWYVVHPGPDADGNSHHYRTVIGGVSSVLVPAGTVTNSPHLDVYQGEVLVPVGQNLVAGQDDFNATFELTRPNCTTGGGGGGGGTVPPTTAAPVTTVPSEPIPDTPGLAPIVAEGFVAPGADIGPGMASFGVTGFAPGEVVEVMLFSTPRSLGTVTATDGGNVTITFEVLASDGAGEHRVEFSGPSGTFSVPFTLVLDAAPTQGLPETR